LLAGSFARLLDLWRGSDPLALAQAWLMRAHPIGTALTVHSGADETASGRFEGIEPDGALRLRSIEGGLEIIRAGDISLA
jgi:BirA family biotin operon repressor/biotin-[acetyl-CoA-carboxylase] ligase